jgi:hypothetical protein
MPPAGWYVDPHQPAHWRYWDGTAWTAHVAPRVVQQPRDPYSFGAWFEDSTAVVKVALRRAGIAVVGVYLAVVVAAVGLITVALRSDDGRELRDLLEVDDWFDGTSTVELTDAEGDRALDLLGDLFWTWLPAGIAFGILAVLLTLWAASYTAVVAWETVGADERAPAPSVIEPPSTWSRSIRRVPAVFASGWVIGAISIAAMAVPLIPLFVVLAADAGGAAIGITATIGGIAAVVLLCWLLGRLSVAVVLAAGGGHGLGLRRSWELTEGHYWGTVGRLLIAGLIAGAASIPFNFTNGFVAAFGVWIGVTIVVLGQAVSSAANVLISVPAQVVLAEHLAAQRDGAGRR